VWSHDGPRQAVKAGRAQTAVFAQNAGQEKLVALVTATLITIAGRDGIGD
jgi:hypothetical protein